MAKQTSPDGQGVVYVMGGAGTGKNTMVRKVAPDIGARWFDTACWYRALTLAVLDEGTDLEAEAADRQIVKLFHGLDVLVEGDAARMNGRDVSVQMRSHAVNAAVSRVAGFGAVRQAVAVRQRQAFGGERPLILIGRSPREPFAEPQLVVQVVKDLHEAARHRAQEQPGVSSTHHDLARRNEHDRRNMVRLGLHSDGVSFDATGLDVNKQAAQFLEILRAEGF